MVYGSGCEGQGSELRASASGHGPIWIWGTGL